MKFRIFLLVILVSVLMAGCGTANSATPSAVTTPTLTVMPTFVPLISTPSPAPTFTPTLSIPLTVTATFEPLRPMPATLMLHRSSLTFDSVKFLKDFIVLLKQNNMHVVTYEDIRKDPDITQRERGKLFIISIDDLYLRYPIEGSVMEMIGLLREAGYPAVLGVVTESNTLYPATISTYRELIALGWEIASHTDTHRNLGIMEKTAPRYVYTEVQTSVDKITNAVGIRPYTLILPEGQMVDDPRFIKRAGIFWIVGINGGAIFDSRKTMIYVGREGPDGTAEQTFKIMMGRFNP